ncbi:MAG: protein-export chaperone SecB [Alphaproteobacteria bacterium]
MADTPGSPPSSPAVPPAGDGQGRPQQRAVPMLIKAQYVKDLSFENPRAPAPMPVGQQPKIAVDIDVAIAGKGGDDHEVVLSLTVNASHNAETLFIVEVHYAGLITVSGLPENLREPLLWIEGARLLFPFARAVIANATRDGGLPPVLLAPVDFMSLYQQKTGKTLQTAAQPAAPAGTA